jgi:hypothetical protein
MELNYYRLVFLDQKEYFIQSNILTTVELINLIEYHHNFIPLQLKEGDPVYFNSDQLLSIQKVHTGIIGNQTKLWRML